MDIGDACDLDFEARERDPFVAVDLPTPMPSIVAAERNVGGVLYGNDIYGHPFPSA